VQLTTSSAIGPSGDRIVSVVQTQVRCRARLEFWVSASWPLASPAVSLIFPAKLFALQVSDGSFLNVLYYRLLGW
jgi:hypothetical protein